MFTVRTIVRCEDEPYMATVFGFDSQPSEGDVERAENAAVAAFWDFYGDDRSCTVVTTTTSGMTPIDTLTGVLR